MNRSLGRLLSSAMAGEGEGGAEDYMGDLSLFLPTESPKKRSKAKPQPPTQPSKATGPKSLSRQQRRHLERERKQREEDSLTAAALDSAIPPSNVGFKLLRQMGYSPGTALGREGAGRAEPVGIEIRRSRAGIGVETPEQAAARREREAAGRKRRRETEMAEEFGSRQKAQWRSWRVVADYRTAEAALVRRERDGEPRPLAAPRALPRPLPRVLRRPTTLHGRLVGGEGRRGSRWGIRAKSDWVGPKTGGIGSGLGLA